MGIIIGVVAPSRTQSFPGRVSPTYLLQRHRQSRPAAVAARTVSHRLLPGCISLSSSPSSVGWCPRRFPRRHQGSTSTRLLQTINGRVDTDLMRHLDQLHARFHPVGAPPWLLAASARVSSPAGGSRADMPPEESVVPSSSSPATDSVRAAAAPVPAAVLPSPSPPPLPPPGRTLPSRSTSPSHHRSSSPPPGMRPRSASCAARDARLCRSHASRARDTPRRSRARARKEVAVRGARRPGPPVRKCARRAVRERGECGSEGEGEGGG